MDPTQADDRTLVEAAQAGDRRAFRELVRRYERRIFSVAYGFLRNEEDALDIVQDAFLKVHRYLPKFEGQSSFYTWLYRIVANLCIDHIRRAKRKRASAFEDRFMSEQNEHLQGAALCVRHMGSPDAAVERDEIRKAFLESLEDLSDNHRTVLILREVQGMSYAEMAEAMGCAKGTIMSRLFHARRNMQNLLAQRGIHMNEPPAEEARAAQETTAPPVHAQEVIAP